MKHLGVIAWGALCSLLAGKVIFIIYMSIMALAIVVNVVYAIKNEIDEYKQLKEASDEYERIKREIKKMKKESENEN